MQLEENQIKLLEWEYKKIEFQYFADCNADGGWTVTTINGENVYHPSTSIEISNLSIQLTTLGKDGWELIDIAGLPRDHDFGHCITMFRRYKERQHNYWEYFVVDLSETNNTWYSYYSGDDEFSPKRPPWDELLPQLEKEHWQLVKPPYAIFTVRKMHQATLKRQL